MSDWSDPVVGTAGRAPARSRRYGRPRARPARRSGDVTRKRRAYWTAWPPHQVRGTPAPAGNAGVPPGVERADENDNDDGTR